MKNLIENQFSSGAIRLHPVKRLLRGIKKSVKGRRFIKGIQTFDWTTGFDIRNSVGTLPIKNQGQYSPYVNDSCGGQSVSSGGEISRRQQNIHEGQLSAKSYYSPISYPGGGTTVNDLDTQFCARGGNLESAVSSYDSTGNPLPELQMADKSWQTETFTQDALTRAGYTPWDVGTNIDDVACAIQTYGWVRIEIEGQNGHVPGWLSPTPQPPIPDNGNAIFAHFICGIGAKMMINPVTQKSEKFIITLESMGPHVGDSGIQYFNETYFNSTFVKDVTCYIHDTQVQPLVGNITTWSNVTRWFKGQWALAQSLV